MSFKRTNQQGFSAVEGLLAVIAVALVFFVGFYVYNANKKTSDTYSSAAKVAQSSPAKLSKAANTQAAAGSQAYLEIKEWGVKIKLATAAQGAYYKPDANNISNPPETMDIYSNQADSLTGPTGKSCTGEYIAYVKRVPNDDPQLTSQDYTVYYSEQKTIGLYTYAIATKKQYGPECFETSSTGDYQVDPVTSGKFDDIVTAFKTSFQTIQAD